MRANPDEFFRKGPVMLSGKNILLLITYTICMAIGQLMFKAAANKSNADNFVVALLTNWRFLAAIALYGSMTVLWVWILREVPLSRAYPFMALAFLITPMCAQYFYSEPLTGKYLVGLALVITGLLTMTLETT